MMQCRHHHNSHKGIITQKAKNILKIISKKFKWNYWNKLLSIQEAKFVLTTCGNTWVSASNAETADSELEIQSWHRTQKDCNCSEG
ncbi:Hypothetical predicted protein [Olea europaea subsp. europaea]|uniref:Uncharacterized protein n=1 Tax=Olea europaea subsp. europaea TaxID=158383 RepID=A0A8S0TDF7_OLEEU|nr:Hypothetical predicted protein [Olea europaea subsp. europaea]